jgi:hypothetical protein
MEPMEVLRSWAVQDSPPGAATAALAARTDMPVGWLDRALADRSVIALYNPRTATAIVPADEAAAFATAFLPPDEDDDARRAIEAVGDALDGRTLSRDDLHEALRHRLPEHMLLWCEGCQSHHARRAVLVTAGLHGKLCLAGKAGRQPAFARTDQLIDWNPTTNGELVHRYKRQYGTSTAAHFAEWAGIEKAHAKQLWTDETAEPERLPGLRVLAPGDPMLLTRERERLIPDPTWRKQLWSAIPTTGLVLDDGEPRALWKARKLKRTLEVTIVAGDAPLDAFRNLAEHRGCTGVSAS